MAAIESIPFSDKLPKFSA